MDISKFLKSSPLNRKAVVIDITGRSVRACECSSGGKLDGHFCEFTLEESIPLDDPVKIAAELKSQLDAANISTACTAVMLAPRSKAVLIDMQMPAGTDENELPEMVRFQAEKELPFAVDSAAMDFRPAPSAGQDETAITLYAVQAATADYYRTIAAESGFARVSLTLRPLALAKLVDMAVDTAPGECVGVISLGGGEIEIDFMIDGHLQFSRSAVAGDSDLNEIAARAKREIALSVQAFGNSYPDMAKPSGMLVCGDAAQSEALREKINEGGDFECELFCPAVPAEAAECDQSWAAVVGASLELPAPQSGLPDLLEPRKSVDVQAIKKQRQGLILLTAMVFVFVMGWLGFMHVSDLKADAQEMEKKVKQAESENTEVGKLVKRVQALKQWDRSAVDWTSHLAFISALAPQADNLYVSGIKTDSKDAVILSVRAKSRDSVEQFIASLNAVENYDVTSPSLPNSRTDPLELGYEYEADLTISMKTNFDPQLPDVLPGRPEDDDSQAELPKRLSRPNNRRSR